MKKLRTHSISRSNSSAMQPLHPRNPKTGLNISTFMFSGVFDSVHLGCSVVCQFKALHVKSSAPHILQMPAALFNPSAALLQFRPRNPRLRSACICILAILLTCSRTDRDRGPTGDLNHFACQNEFACHG